MTSQTVKCINCEYPTVDLKKWQLDRMLKWQVFLTANKPKYSKTRFAKLFSRSERLIRDIDPEFYQQVKK